MRRLSLFAVSFLLLVIGTYSGAVSGCGGGGGGDGGGGGIVSVNDLDGATDIAADSVFKYAFSQAIDTTTVTNQTFFMVESNEAVADASKASIDPAKCDNAQAIDAIVSCLTTTECTLDPTANLGSYRRYFVCLGTDIMYGNGNPFEGFMATFTTARSTYSVGGTVTGLGEGEQVVLQNNAADDLTVTADGAFTFATGLANGAAFAVTVLTAPTYKVCTVGSGTGAISSADVTNVNIVCSYSSVTVGGTVTGLDAGDQVVLQNNSSDDLTITANGSFTFATRVANGGTYNVTVLSSPNQKTCTPTNNTGTASDTYISNVAITCTTPQPALWGMSVTEGSTNSRFYGGDTNADGDVYAAGVIYGTDQFNFGNGKTVTAAGSTGNAVLVKYNSSGETQWVKSTVTAPDLCLFRDAAVDTDGNIYAVGYIRTAGEYDFGNGVTAQGGGAGNNLVLVKYNSAGTPQWAKTATGGVASEYEGVAIDTANNVYAIGLVASNDEIFLGDGVSVTPAYAGNNILIVKYNSAGTTQWAKSTSTAPNASRYYSVHTDSDNNIYAAGMIDGDAQFDFGNSKTVTGAYSIHNALLLKYAANGTPQWAKSVVSGSNSSIYYGVTVAPDDNVYAVGTIYSNGTYGFGNEITVSGSSLSENAVTTKYNSSGSAQWVRSAVSGDESTAPYDTCTDDTGNVYVTGQMLEGTHNFGNGISVVSLYEGGNPLILMYSSTGLAQWAKSTTVSPNASRYEGIACHGDGYVYGLGSIEKTSPFGFGNGVTVTGLAATSSSVVIVQYDQP